MGMCSRQERIQKDIDIVIQKCKAEKDCLFADFRYADSTFTFTYVGGSKRLAKEMAVKNEVGLTYNPLKITWLEGQPQSSTVFADGTIQPHISQDSVVSERDYESLVMMRMRQASERQKLIEKMKQEDEEESCT